MTPAEARKAYLVLDTLTMASQYALEKVKEAKKEGLITAEEQQEQLDKVQSIRDSLE